MNTYIMDGGIGKQVTFTAIIDALVKKDKEQIQICTFFSDIFKSNPNVKNIYAAWGYPREYGKSILESQNIFYKEPYRSNFVKGEIHIIQSWCELFDLKYEEKMRPELFTDHYNVDAKQVVGDGEFIVVQFSGGQDLGKGNQPVDWMYNFLRSYPDIFVQKVIDLIKEKYENLRILCFALPNEPKYEKTEPLELMPFVQWHEILKMSNCKGFISIDSCLPHIARSAGRRGVVIWCGSRWTQLGYKQNMNINNWRIEWDEWDNEKFEVQDPRNIMVEPERVFEQFEKIYGKGLINV